MSDNINFRPAVKPDIPQLVELLNSQYNRKKNELYFLWQYFNSPYRTLLMCAFINSKLIGMFGLQARELENGAHAGQAIDMLVAREWRGKGLFKSLSERAIVYLQGLDLLCVLPNLSGKNACEKALGWKTLCKINSMCLSREHFNNLSTETSKNFFPYDKRRIAGKFRNTDEIRAWRFDKHPDYKYTYVRLITGEFAITKVFEGPVTGVRLGDIVDFECELNNKKLLRELFIKAVTQLKVQEVESITTWALPHTPLREVVDSMGFTEFPMERYFCLKVLKQKYEYLYNIENWHLVQSDAEIY